MKPEIQKMIALNFIFTLVVQTVSFMLLSSMIKWFLRENQQHRPFPGIDIKDFK